MDCEKSMKHSQLSYIRQCKCGTIHLAIGPVILKFDRQGFDSLVRGVNEAAEVLDPPAVVKGAPVVQLRDRTVQ